MNGQLICQKCGSDNVNVQMTTETVEKTKRRGILWWLFIGSWWVPIKWIFLTIPALIVKIFSRKRTTTKTVHHKHIVCQACGHSWSG